MGMLKYTDEVVEAINDWDGILSAPSKKNRKRLEGIPVFANGFLERYFGSAHPITPGVWFIPVIAVTTYLSVVNPTVGPLWTAGFFSLGVLAWTLIEYLLHRYVFHLTPTEKFESKFRIFMMHGYHHEFTNDKRRLVAPPVMSWPLGLIVAGIYYLAAGPNLWMSLFAGTCLGYLGYDWIHYYTHHFRPTTRLGKFLRRYHMEHHFKDQETHFGISVPLWDLVFGTYSRPVAQTALEIELIGADDDGTTPASPTGTGDTSDPAATPSV